MASRYVMLSLSDADQKMVAELMTRVPEVRTPAEAILWALRTVSESFGSPPPQGTPDTPTPSGGGGGGGGGGGYDLGDLFNQPSIPPGLGRLGEYKVPGFGQAVEIKLDDLLTCGVKPLVTVDANDLVKIGLKTGQLRQALSTATRGRALAGVHAIPRVSLGPLKK